MVTLHEVITFLVSMQISISSLQTHNVNRCGRSRHLARKLSLRRKRSSPNVFEMAATETITSIILIKLIRVSLGTVRHPRRFMIIPMLCVTIFVILVVWFLLPRVARLMIHTPTAISIFVCLSMVQLMAVFISMRCTLCGHFLQVALTLILVVGYAIAAS